MNKQAVTKIVNEVEAKINAVQVNKFTGEVIASRVAKVSKKDIRVVVEYWISGDYSKVEATKLYTKQGGRYCRVLEILNRMRIARAHA